MARGRKTAAVAPRRPAAPARPAAVTKALRQLTPEQRAIMRAALAELSAGPAGKTAAPRSGLWKPAKDTTSAYARAHHSPLWAAASVGAADLSVIAAHAAGGGIPALATVGTLGAAAGVQTYRKVIRRKAQRSKRTRWWAGSAWAASAGTMLAGSAAGMASAPGQGIMLAGGLVVAAPYLYRHRWRPPRNIPAELPVVDAVPVGDPRIEAFRERFCRSGVCKGARLHSLREVPSGFAFEIALAEGSDGTTADVMTLVPKIAARYDVSADQVSVEYVLGRSEKRAQVTVLTVQDAWKAEDRWDGVSTYDRATGTFRLGRFADSTDVHYLLNRPGSGAAGAVIAGLIGGGKTGTTHVIASEVGQARLCRACGADATCDECDLQRIAALWMGDPQMQPLGVWRGFADLMGWGPWGCVQMLLMAHAAMRKRAARRGSMKWTDHRGRVNEGKGWFDPTPDEPIIYVVIDEWPIIMKDPLLAAIAAVLAASLIREGRKVGIALVLLTQMPDVEELGLRAIRELLKAFNVISHRTDGLSKHMLGIQGNTAALAPGVHGLGYINGYDNRPAATMRTKHLPEYAKPGDDGVDVRELAERIAGMPLTIDPAVTTAAGTLGYTGRFQVVDGFQFRMAVDAVQEDKRSRRPIGLTPATALAGIVSGDPFIPDPAGAAAGTALLDRAEPGGPDGPPLPPEGTPVQLPLLAVVLAQRGQMDLYDVSEASGCDAFEADIALGQLVRAGLAIEVEPGQYRSTMAAAEGSDLA